MYIIEQKNLESNIFHIRIKTKNLRRKKKN